MIGPTSCQSTSVPASFKLGSASSWLLLTCHISQITNFHFRFQRFFCNCMTAVGVGAGRQSLLTELPPDSENAASPAPATHKHLNVCSLDVRMMIRQKMQKPNFLLVHCIAMDCRSNCIEFREAPQYQIVCFFLTLFKWPL